MGGSGGGGSSGAVDYPAYIKNIQSDWLSGVDGGGVGATTIDAGYDITSLLNLAFANNPWLGAIAFDPATHITAMLAAPTTFNTNATAAIQELEDYLALVGTTDEIEGELATFDIGMRNTNAVQSSTYVIARDIIASSWMTQKLQVTQTITQFKLELNNKVLANTIEANKLAIIAYKDETDGQFELDHSEASWNFEMYSISANVLASIAGGTVSTPVKPNKIIGALSAGAAGAAAGGMVGSVVPVYGTTAGAIIGGVLGVAASFIK